MIEELAAKVHNAWWDEKAEGGFHSPADCPHRNGRSNMFSKHCDNCHPAMYPYGQLPETVKDYDRVTVRTVLRALGELAEG